MSPARPRRRPQPRARPRGLAPVTLVLALTALAVAATLLTGDRLAEEQARARAAAAAAERVAVVAAAVASAMDRAADEGSARPGAAAAGAEGLTGAVRARARDSGQPVVDDTAAPVVVVAVYGSAPATVPERRGQVVGFLSVPLDLTETLGRLQPPGGGMAVDGRRGRLWQVPSSAPRGAPSHTVPFAPDTATRWSLTVWTAPAPTPLGAWVAALLLAAAGIALAAWMFVRQRAHRSHQAELEGLQRTSDAVAGLALVAQRTLDLSEALPAVTTELGSSLGLSGLALSVPTGAGGRPLFSWGSPPGDDPAKRGVTRLPAGETLALRLSRGGRTVADLQVVAGRDLDQHDVRTLAAAGEVLTSVLSNAEAFTQQQDLVDRMRGLDELKSVFLATASHELRTPVATIAGYASLLHEQWDSFAPDQARSMAQRVDSTAQRLSRMVEDLLDFSRLERGQDLGDANAVFDLGEVVGQVLDDYPDLAPEHRVDLRSAPGLLVSGSRTAAERVVTNLVGNAAKYSPAGGEIRVLVQAADNGAELVVEDDGPGVSATERAQVFSRFYRGRGDEVTRTRGAGLGLAIVTEFAASMGGQVRVTTGENGGARFAVSFPVADPVTDRPPDQSPDPDPVPVPDADPGAAHVRP